MRKRRPGSGPVPAATDDASSGISDGVGGVLDVVGSVGEATSAGLETAGGCFEGCSCSLAVVISLTAATGTAYAFFR